MPLDQLRQVPASERGNCFPGVQMFIDPDECIDCGACEAECPVAAIYLDDDVPAEHRGDIERNAAFFRK
ncbi:MAG TPA: ferredoxin family protein [Kofleriaceae bacterium]